MLGDRDRRHLQLDRLIEQLVDPAGAVEQRELGVQMKMDELSHDRHSIAEPQNRRADSAFSSSIAALHSMRHSHSIVDGGFDEMS